MTLLLERLVDPAYRLMTLVGAGGMGKTRLALEVGQQVINSFPDGVWFVPLDAVHEGAEQIQTAVGEAMGLGQDDKQLSGDRVLALLRDKQALLILDNCESVLDALAFIPEWLRRAPNIAILATSREPLNFEAESVVALSGLPTGESALAAAEALFAERGRMARSDFEPTADALPQIRRICQLVDGSPLGIGLAAAWVRRRSLPQIIDAIGGSLDFLSTRLRDVDPRHRSMRAVFETSWAMLESGEQTVLAALAVFPTAFSAEAAAAVAQATLFDLDTLCEKSLLMQDHESERYQLHALVRQFAGEKLGEGRTAVSQAFSDYYVHYANAHHTDYAALQPEWLNLSTAVATAHRLTQWQQVLDLVQRLDEPWFHQIRFSEMRQGLTLAIEAAAAIQNEPALARMLLRLGEIEMELNDYTAADSRLTEAMQRLMRLEDSVGIAQAYYLNGRIKSEQGEDSSALKLYEASLNIFESEHERWGVAKNLNLIGVVHLKNRDFLVAKNCWTKAAELQRQAPATSTYIETLRYLTRVKILLGDYTQAELHLEQGLEISSRLNDKGEYAALLFEKLLLCKVRKQYDRALAVGNECLEQFKQLGSMRWEGLVCTQLGLMHQAKQAHEQAFIQLEKGLNIFEQLGDLFEQAYSYYYLHLLYDEIGEPVRSEQAKREAVRLNQQLNNPRLAELLA